MTVDTSTNERAVSFGDISEEGIDEDEVEKRLRNMHFNKAAPQAVPRDHRVVARLSRWEGGGTYDKELFNRPARGKFDEEEQKHGSDQESDAAEHQTVTLRDVVRVFRRSDALMTVDDEDIERVKIMHEKFSESSRFSFNYNALLLIASIIAALGLGSNSVASIIASMLVSPLMGPVVGE